MSQTLRLAFAVAAAIVPASAAFNNDTGNAPLELVIPTAAPIIFQDVSPSGGDATLVLRYTTLITNAWFDSTAPYHPTAQGIYSRLGRRPAIESTNRNMNTALLFASYRVLNSLSPGRNAAWRGMLIAAGLNPDDTSENLTTAIGIGNRAGRAIVQARERDGMNQLGDEGGRLYNRQPYADYTGYEPVNTAYELKDPSRWQPRMTHNGFGIFKIQQFVTPQTAHTRPYSFSNPNQFNVPRPNRSDPRNREAYRQQADEVIQASANLTDHQKMAAEFFNNKIQSLGFSAVFAAQSRGLSVLDFIHLDFLTNVAAFDTAIAAWNQKAKWDAVRPYSAIRYLYGNRPITAWGGPGKGTVTNIPASQWKEYLDVADHPEYPSGSATFCAAHAQSARLFLGSDVLNWTVPQPAGSSVVEPGITPASNISLNYPTWSDFEVECGLSRFWAGVHFRASIDEGAPMGRAIGTHVYNYVKRHIDGNAPPLN